MYCPSGTALKLLEDYKNAVLDYEQLPQCKERRRLYLEARADIEKYFWEIEKKLGIIA